MIELDIINASLQLFQILTRPLVIDVPTYIQSRTDLQPQLVIPSLFFILLVVAVGYFYLNQDAAGKLSGNVNRLLRSSAASVTRPSSSSPGSRVVGRQRLIRPSG